MLEPQKNDARRCADDDDERSNATPVLILSPLSLPFWIVFNTFKKRGKRITKKK